MTRTRLQSRFEHVSPTTALIILAALLLALIMGATTQKTPEPKRPPPHHKVLKGDVDLYKLIIKDVKAGENYYRAVAREHRLYGYQLKPVFTVRLPTLAFLFAKLPRIFLDGIFLALIVSIIMAWHLKLQASPPKLISRFSIAYVGTALIFFSCALLNTDNAEIFHDTWAGLFLALSLALWRPDHFLLSILFGLCAVFIRELALPYLFLMAMTAVFEKYWREAAYWITAIILFGIIYWLHTMAVANVGLPSDVRSGGWHGLGGIEFFITALVDISVFEVLPRSITGIIAVLCVFGWLSWKHEIGLRVALFILCYAVMIMAFARYNTLYWFLMIEPLFLAGLIFVPQALSDLVAQARTVFFVSYHKAVL